MNAKTQTQNRIDGVRPPTELLRDFTQLSRRFERKIEALTAVIPTDRVVMETLIQRGPLSPSDLAHAASITPAAMTASIDRLIDLGHVTRDPHPTDRRKLVITATENSVRIIMTELIAMVTDVNGVLSDFSPEELTTITRFLERVNGAYSRHVSSDS